MPIIEAAAFNVVLDPGEIAVARTQLFLNDGPIMIDQAGIDWGDAAITAYMADQRWGSLAVDFRVPNRIVTIPLFLGAENGLTASAQQEMFQAAKKTLKQKVALLQREGGSLKRGDTGWYADIESATLTFPDVWGETGSIETGVKLVLECLPDFYGDEIALDTILSAFAGEVLAVLEHAGQPAVIEGDHPGRCRIIITDLSGNNQKGLFWGYRSRHHDPAPTAALAFAAGDLTPLGGATVTGDVVTYSPLDGGSWCPVLLTDLAAGGPMTHVGSYRVKVRVNSPGYMPQLRFVWGPGGVASPVFNAPVQLPAADGLDYVIDLGAIRVDQPPVGNHMWQGLVQALAVADGEELNIDRVWLVPVDESAGEMSAVQSPSPFGIQRTLTPTIAVNDAAIGTVDWLIEGVSATTSAPLAAQTTHFLKATGFGFTIPVGATISGISVSVQKVAATSELAPIVDAGVRLVKNVGGVATVQATDRSDPSTPWFNTPQIAVYGGETDLWGAVWAAADVNDPKFGFAIAASGSGASGVPSVYTIALHVYFTTAGGYTQALDAVVYADQMTELRTEGVFRQDPTGTVFAPVPSVVGDLPRIPPSGLEGRPVELLVKLSDGDLAAVPETVDGSLGVQVLYRPSFIFPP